MICCHCVTASSCCREKPNQLCYAFLRNTAWSTLFATGVSINPLHGVQLPDRIWWGLQVRNDQKLREPANQGTAQTVEGKPKWKKPEEKPSKEWISLGCGALSKPGPELRGNTGNNHGTDSQCHSSWQKLNWEKGGRTPCSGHWGSCYRLGQGGWEQKLGAQWAEAVSKLERPKGELQAVASLGPGMLLFTICKTPNLCQLERVTGFPKEGQV